MKHTYKGTDGQVGFVSAWESDHEQVGTGEQEIMKIEDGKQVDVKLRFKVPFESESDGFLITEDAGEGKTKVTWGFSGSFPVPMNIMLLFMDMDAAVGKDFEEGLADLKVVMEKQESPKQEPSEEDPNSEEKDTDAAKTDSK